jgi:hypothetical protein
VLGTVWALGVSSGFHIGHTGGMDTVLALRTALATTAQRRLAEVRIGALQATAEPEPEQADSDVAHLARTA